MSFTNSRRCHSTSAAATLEKEISRVDEKTSRTAIRGCPCNASATGAGLGKEVLPRRYRDVPRPRARIGPVSDQAIESGIPCTRLQSALIRYAVLPLSATPLSDSSGDLLDQHTDPDAQPLVDVPVFIAARTALITKSRVTRRPRSGRGAEQFAARVRQMRCHAALVAPARQISGTPASAASAKSSSTAVTSRPRVCSRVR
jgi:hypothetical protein